MARVADAVHHAHLAGLIHRDLKPSNILLDSQGVPKVCDFGLAVDEEVQRLRRGEVAGTLPYMAPEQVRGETNHLDGRTDIWALGVILYRGLPAASRSGAGRRPSTSTRSSAATPVLLVSAPGESRGSSSGSACAACRGRSGERYLTAEDLAEDLRRWLAGANAEAQAADRRRRSGPRD